MMCIGLFVGANDSSDACDHNSVFRIFIGRQLAEQFVSEPLVERAFS
jgi:hypothetical protein